MDTALKKTPIYTFFATVVTVLSFAVCFYLFIVSFVGTFRHIADLGLNRVLFLNSVIVLLVALIGVLGIGIWFVKSEKISGFFAKFENKDQFERTKTILKILIFFECVALAAIVFGIRQRADQYSVQYSAYGLSWGITEVLTPPRHLSGYPNNSGFVFALYLLSFITGNYNNAVVMLIFSALVPFIYSDLAEIGGKFGLSRKSQIMVMLCGLFFLPLQTKVTFIYGDIPGLFFAVRAMKHAVDMVQSKAAVKKQITVIAFIAIAYVLKNNYLIFAIAIAVYLFAELLKQRRFKELYIPVAVLAAPVLLISVVNLIFGSILGGTVPAGASKYSWIAMGMQEQAGTSNGYNDVSFYEAGFDAELQAEWSKAEIANRLNYFISKPNQAVGFYIRKVMVQWSDPTFSTFDFLSKNVYVYNSASPLVWLISSPKVISAAASFLKIFQVIMFLGSCVFSINVMRRKESSPSLLLFITFIGGFFFHIIWEAGPSYAVPYFVLTIPLGVAGAGRLIKLLSGLNMKANLMKSKVQISASGVICFIAGAVTFLIAAAGIGTIRQLLVEGRNEYRTYFSELITRTREPVEEGRYILKSADPDLNDGGIEIKLVRYAGRYRMQFEDDSVAEEIYLTNDRGQVKIDWCSYDETQEFVIINNGDNTYTICQGISSAMFMDPEKGMRVEEFIDYTYWIDSPYYDNFISEHPNVTWNLIPVS